MNTKGSKHLTLEEREIIQESLDMQMTRERISELVSKDRKTISYEIQRRRNKVDNQRYSSYQKGAIEENHELIRYIVPKHTVFDHLTPAHAQLMTSHINSYNRKIIDTTPYLLFEAYFGKDILAALNCRCVPPEDVNLTPGLLK